MIDEEKTGCVHCVVRERNNKDVERNEREQGGIKTQDRGSREERKEREREREREPGQRALLRLGVAGRFSWRCAACIKPLDESPIPL